MKITAIIPAAGSGERFGGKKQLKRMGNQPLLFHTLQPFISSELINEIVVVVSKDDLYQVERKLNSTISIKTVKSNDPNYTKDTPQRRCPDLSLIKKSVNFTPKINFEEGLKRVYKLSLIHI